MQRSRIFLAALVAFAVTSSGVATATIILPSPDLPPQAGAYLASGPILFPGPIEFVDFQLDNFQNVTTTPDGSDEIISFDATMSLTVDDGSGPQPAILTGPTQWIAYGKAGRTTGTFATEILSMSLSGDVVGVPIEIRESPPLASAGMTAITDVGGGVFAIDSFFDVFVELSIAGGPFQPQLGGPERFVLTPEPTTALLLACGLVGLGVRRRLH